ncbi:MAG: ABC transporter permease [Paludibacteraceae bacterium]|nr:ABC transporter permease [Paludibacteraceae bacterium]
MNILSEIWSSISRQKFRTAMTGFAVAWGIFILVVLLGASNGLQNGINDRYGNQVNNMVTVYAGHTSMPYKGLKEDRQLYFTEKEATLVRQMPEVELFSIVRNTSMNINYKNQYTTASVKGVENDYQKIYQKDIYKGRFLNNSDNRQMSKVCVIDKRTAQDLMTDSLVGRYLQIGNIPFLIVGICENGNNWEGSTIHIPFSTYKSLYSTDGKFYQMTFTVNDQADVITKAERGKSRWESSSPFEEKLRTVLSPSMQFDKSDNRALWVNSQADEYEQQQGVMNAIRLFVLIIGICTLISGAVGVSNIMLVSVRERTKEFGIRKAIGAPPATILTTVVGESILITAMFGYIGMFVGIGIMELINRFVPQGDFPFRNPTVDIPAVAIATFILIIVGVIAGAIPAIKAMKIKPIEALNYEK